jgi:hypothetical protein
MLRDFRKNQIFMETVAGPLPVARHWGGQRHVCAVPTILNQDAAFNSGHATGRVGVQSLCPPWARIPPGDSIFNA